MAQLSLCFPLDFLGVWHYTMSMANNACPLGPGRSDRTGISLKELFDRFPDDAAAEAWFIKLRWPDGICCPHCGSVNVKTGCAHKTMPYRCREKDCAKRFSVKVGTVMEASNLKFQVWAIAIYQMMTSLKGVSSMKLHRDLNITQKSAWHLAHRLRTTWDRAQGPFSGPVEVDESYFGGKAKNMHAKKRAKLKGRGSADKTMVVGIKDHASGKIKAAVLEKGKGPVIKPWLLKNITPDAMVYSDEAKVYSTLPNHKMVSHGFGVYVDGPVTTNSMESFWSLLKRGYVGIYHRMSPVHLWRYVTEFVGRHNDRDLDTIDQMANMARNMEGRRLRYKDLIGHGQNAEAI